MADIVPIGAVRAAAYVVPTETKESDGTLEWEHTTLVVVEVDAGGRTGVGWTYSDKAAAELVHEKLASTIRGVDAMAIPAACIRMAMHVRNDGRAGVASTAMSAVEAALWDLKGKLLGQSVMTLLGACRSSAAVYGSGGFTSYTDEQLRDQLGGWVAQGIPRVKMKVGREPVRDPHRVRVAREAIGDALLFVDANGAYTRKQALELAGVFRDAGVVWFEEPVSSDDLEGLRLLRDRAPAGMDVAAGEYGYDTMYFRRMLEAQAVDVLQADATRCGVSGFLRADALCEGYNLTLSGHCAPSLHAQIACAARRFVHIEYFHDHALIEHRLFDGAPQPRGGALWPDPARPGFGVEFKRPDAERLRAA